MTLGNIIVLIGIIVAGISTITLFVFLGYHLIKGWRE